MSGIVIKDTVNPALKKLISQLQDPKEFLVELGKAERTEVELRFRNEEDPDSKTWKPSFRALKEGGQTLTDTSFLRNSFEFVVQNNSLFVGTPVAYSQSHQTGIDIVTGRPLPVRKILGINENTMKNARAIFKELMGV